MRFHILNGDALRDTFPPDITGERISIREAFMEGPVAVQMDEGYWGWRTQYVGRHYGITPQDYKDSFFSQLDKMKSIRELDEVYLWFEDDLFCQVNMWLALNLILSFSHPKFYRVFPAEDPVRWRGFGDADDIDLKSSFAQAKMLTPEDVMLTQALWGAYVSNEAEKLTELAKTSSAIFRFLPQIIHAHLERLHPDVSRRQPQKLLREIMLEGHESFEDIFATFSKRAGYYGYGDAQIRRIILSESEFAE